MPASALPSSLLFACNRNAVRSPMAAALARHYMGSRTFIDSAGIDPGETDPFCVAVLSELGIDLSGHVPRAFDEVDDGSFEVIITLAPEAHHKALELTRTFSVEVEYWPTPDPTVALEIAANRESVLSAYRDVRTYLNQRILKRFFPDPPASL